MSASRALLLLLLAAPGTAMAQTAPIANSVTSTNAGQASGTVLNSNTQLNQLPVLQQEFGAGYRCQGATVSFSPYWLGSSTSYGNTGGANGYGAVVSLSAPLDTRASNLCVDMARARVAKEQFDLAITRTLKCADLLRAGIVFTAPATQGLCDGLAYDPRRDATKGAVLPDPPKQTPQLVITR